MEILPQETDEERWGCANRIVNGRAVCDSHHITVRMWMADFRQHMQEGDATDDRDGSIMKTLVEAIIVWDDRIEVCFKCGATVEQKYVE